VAYRQTHQPHWRRNLQGEALEATWRWSRRWQRPGSADEHLGDLCTTGHLPPSVKSESGWRTNLPGLDIPPRR
jgi:hypothetical protein